MRLSWGSKIHYEPGSLLEALHDIQTGVVSGTVRTAAIFATWIYVNVVRPIATLLGVSLPEGKRDHVLDGTLKVAAVGFGRTGTYSLSEALEELGFPTLHTIHMYAYENEEIFRMWSENLVNPSIEAKQPLLGEMDVKLIADSGYEAISDIPLALFYEQIIREFPDCKFILTTRESSEIWYQSWTTMTRSVTLPMYVGSFLFPTLRHFSNYLRWLNAYVNQDPSYLTTPFPRVDSIKENAIIMYESHNRRVRQVIPANQLLEYNIKEGWKPLCDFLEVLECPETPFPKSNSARQMRVQSAAAFWAGLITFLLISYHFIKRIVKKVKSKMD